MAGRFPDTKYFDGCLNPVAVYHHGIKYIVPCGRCSACLLSRSNKWNFRLSDAIDNCAFSIFFTLTYNNYYVPKVHLFKSFGGYELEFDSRNVRFNSVEDVERQDPLPAPQFLYTRCWPIIQNYDSPDYFAYSSKQDVQLWLKLLRRSIDKDLVETNLVTKENAKIRYYIISEYGPTTFRPHCHGVIFCQSKIVSDYLIESALYQNWKMCNKTLFDEYTHLCDNGASGYLSSYLTCFDSLPWLLKESEFKPWRLSSRKPALGFERFSKTEIWQKVSCGSIEYTKTIARIDSSYVFQYPSDYTVRLFPKCYEYSLQSFAGLLRIYGKLFTYVIRERRKTALLFAGLLEGLQSPLDILFSVISLVNFVNSEFERYTADFRRVSRPIDYYCARACYEYCFENDSTPSEYLYLLDNYYYRKGMLSLKYYYEWQQESDALDIMFSYVNLLEYRSKYHLLNDIQRNTLNIFLSAFGVDTLDFVYSEKYSAVHISQNRLSFENELDDILKDMVKLKKINEMSGYAPTLSY